MKITILTQYYPPEIGAPQGRLSSLARSLAERGHTVTVLTALPNYPQGRVYPGYSGLLHREQLDGVQVLRTFIFPTQKLNTFARLASYFSFVFSSALIGSALLEKPDYLLVESPPLFLGLSGCWLAWLKGARLIFNVSDLWPGSAVDLGVIRQTSIAYRISAWLEAFCYRQAWLVSGQSNSIIKNIAERFPAARTYLLSNGVDTSLFQPMEYSARAEFVPHANDFVAIYAGLHGLAQGLDQVLTAALQAPECQFVLIGDGPEKQNLIAQAAQAQLSNLCFLDPQPATQIPARLAAADVVLVVLKTAIAGAVPSKLYEAMASGRPVVLVDRGEASNIVRQYKAGLVVEPGDNAGLAAALRLLREQSSLRQELGANGRRAVETHFDKRKIMAQFIDFLENELPHA